MIGVTGSARSHYKEAEIPSLTALMTMALCRAASVMMLAAVRVGSGSRGGCGTRSPGAQGQSHWTTAAMRAAVGHSRIHFYLAATLRSRRAH